MYHNSVRVSLFSLLAGCVLAIAVQPSAAASDLPQGMAATIYYGCVNNSTGDIRIVSKSTVCKSTEHKISWDKTGPQGPQGPTGPTGPKGPPGISVGNFASNINFSYLGAPVVVAQTNPVLGGQYYVDATAVLYIDSADYS